MIGSTVGIWLLLSCGITFHLITLEFIGIKIIIVRNCSDLAGLLALGECVKSIERLHLVTGTLFHLWNTLVIECLYSLPPYFVVPESVADQALYHVARLHHGNRLPVCSHDASHSY